MLAATASCAAGTMAESPCVEQAPDTQPGSTPPSDALEPKELPPDEDSTVNTASGPQLASENAPVSPEHATDPTLSHVPFCRRSTKTKPAIRVKPDTKIDVAQPLAPALAASSHALATIPLAPALGAAYPFPALAAPHLLPHPLVSLPLQVPRRAVRIAPMGVMPLPPPGTAAIVADFHAAVVAEENTRLNELSKSKRRTPTTSAIASEQALSPEEMARQKRMLRNRESAARSRDKRRNRNMKLQSSIERYRAKKKEIDSVMQELNALCQTMRSTLEKYNLSVPTP